MNCYGPESTDMILQSEIRKTLMNKEIPVFCDTFWAYVLDDYIEEFDFNSDDDDESITSKQLRRQERHQRKHLARARRVQPSTSMSSLNPSSSMASLQKSLSATHYSAVVSTQPSSSSVLSTADDHGRIQTSSTGDHKNKEHQQQAPRRKRGEKHQGRLKTTSKRPEAPVIEAIPEEVEDPLAAELESLLSDDDMPVPQQAAVANDKESNVVVAEEENGDDGDEQRDQQQQPKEEGHREDPAAGGHQDNINVLRTTSGVSIFTTKSSRHRHDHQRRERPRLEPEEEEVEKSVFMDIEKKMSKSVDLATVDSSSSSPRIVTKSPSSNRIIHYSPIASEPPAPLVGGGGGGSKQMDQPVRSRRSSSTISDRRLPTDATPSSEQQQQQQQQQRVSAPAPAPPTSSPPPPPPQPRRRGGNAAASSGDELITTSNSWLGLKSRGLRDRLFDHAIHTNPSSSSVATAATSTSKKFPIHGGDHRGKATISTAPSNDSHLLSGWVAQENQRAEQEYGRRRIDRKEALLRIRAIKARLQPSDP